MAKKNSLKISFEGFTPLVIVFIFISLTIIILERFLGITLEKSFFSCPSKFGTAGAFNPMEVKDYLRFFLHFFGNINFETFAINGILLLLLGSEIEMRFGSLFTLIMCLVASIVTAVVNVCFMVSPCAGLTPLVWMFFILKAFPAEDRKTLELIYVFSLLLFVSMNVFQIIYNDEYSIIAQMIGGFVGSLISLAAYTPKRRAKTTKSGSAGKGIKKASND